MPLDGVLQNISLTPPHLDKNAVWVHNCNKPGKKAADSSKNEQHGDGGRAIEKANKQNAGIDEQIKNATSKKERQRLERKKRNNLDAAHKKKKGTNHSQGKKR